MKKNYFAISTCVAVCLLFLSCSKENTNANEATSLSTEANKPGDVRINPREGIVFTMSNAASQNAILAFEQNSNGNLTFVGSTPAGGNGTGSPLGSQGAVVHNYAESFLYAVNAGSNTVSSFQIHHNGTLSLVSTVSSGGIRPVALANYNDLLYVANAGSASVSGLRINPDGTLSPIAGSTQALSAVEAIPGNIAFKPDGKFLLVAEKTTNRISAFPIGADGKAGASVFHSTSGQGPAAFAFIRGSFTGTDYIIVPELGSGPNSSSISTYGISGSGVVSNVQVSMPLQQATATSVATTKDGIYSFVSNTGSNSIAAFKTGSAGSIQLLHASAGSTDNAPADLALSGNEKYVYVLNKISHTISGHKRMNNESLSSMNSVTIPASASGLAAVNKLVYH